MNGRPELVRRAEQYVQQKGLLLGRELGSGVHGTVLAVEDQSGILRAAIKIHEQEIGYVRERDVYLRLSITTMACGFSK